MGDYDDVGLSDEELAALEADDDGADAGDDSSADDDNPEGTGATDNTDDDDDDGDADGTGAAEQDGEGEDGSGEDDDNSGDAGTETEDDDSGDDGSDDATGEGDDTNADTDGEGDDTAEPSEDPIKAHEQELVDLKAKFDEGEITIDEYVDQRAKVEREIVRIEVSRDYERSKVEDAWKDSQTRFFGQNAYLKENDVLYGAFASQVNALLQTPEGQAMSNDDLLSKAKEAVDSAFGRKEESAPKEEPKPDPVKDAKKAAADRSKVPQTLQGVPAAESNTDTVSKFAYLDKLEGEDYENAVRKLTPAEQEAWINER